MGDFSISNGKLGKTTDVPISFPAQHAKEGAQETSFNASTCLTSEDPIRLLFYGGPGLHKSSVAACFPDPLFLLTENPGISGIRTLASNSGGKLMIRDMGTMKAVLNDLLNGMHQPYKTLILDNITGYDETLAAKIEEIETPNLRGKLFAPNMALGGHGSASSWMQVEHTKIRNMMTKISEKFGVSIIYIAHQRITEIPVSGLERADCVIPNTLYKGVSQVYCQQDIDGVFYFARDLLVIKNDKTGKNQAIEREEGNIIIHTQPSTQFLAKSRYRDMPAQINASDSQLAAQQIMQHIPFYKFTTGRENG